jgi:hypothetical protein
LKVRAAVSQVKADRRFIRSATAVALLRVSAATKAAVVDTKQSLLQNTRKSTAFAKNGYQKPKQWHQ